jgi:hypothetical protein
MKPAYAYFDINENSFVAESLRRFVFAVTKETLGHQGGGALVAGSQGMIAGTPALVRHAK